MADYLPQTDASERAMLDVLGIQNASELYADIPDSARASAALGLPAGMSEWEAETRLRVLADKNRIARDIFRGAGCYDHYIPACVDALAEKEEFVTAYTPYQAEISQGILQATFEYQSEICALTGMEVSNASVYDGATAAAEAFIMCLERDRTRVAALDTVPPQVLECARTYLAGRGVELVTIPHGAQGSCDRGALERVLSEGGIAALLFASPNYYGVCEDAFALCAAAHEGGARAIYYANPMALSVLRTPAECGADIAVGDGQPLGLPMAYGGPSFGFMACKSELMRRLPGRIVGETVDADGARAFVLTLQAREQHIRREKALSNICSNEAHCALRASVYLAALGANGLQNVANSCIHNAHALLDALAPKGFVPLFDAQFFHEFVTAAPDSATLLNRKLARHGILGPLPIMLSGSEALLWCATEKTDEGARERLLTALGEAE